MLKSWYVDRQLNWISKAANTISGMKQQVDTISDICDKWECNEIYNEPGITYSHQLEWDNKL